MIADLVYVEDSGSVLLFVAEDCHGGPIWVKAYRNRTAAADDAVRSNLLSALGVQELRNSPLESPAAAKVEIERPKEFLSLTSGWLPWLVENQVLH